MRVPTQKSSLTALSEYIEIKTVLDVGVAKGTWPLWQIYSNAKHILIEADPSARSQLIDEYKNIDYDYHNIALSDDNRQGQVFIKGFKGRQYKWVGVVHPDEERCIGQPLIDAKIATLDTFLQDKSYEFPMMLKVDVDGDDMRILKGAENTLSNMSILTIEAVIPGLQRVIKNLNFITDHGLRLWDIVDLMYADNRLHQVDLIFVNTDHFPKEALDPSSEKNYSFYVRYCKILEGARRFLNETLNELY